MAVANTNEIPIENAIAEQRATGESLEGGHKP